MKTGETIRLLLRSLKRSLKDYTVNVYVWWFAYVPTELLNIGLTLASWFYYTRFVAGTTGQAEWFLSYILIALMIVPLLNIGVEQPEVTLRSLYRGHVSTGGFRVPVWAYYYLAGIPKAVAAVAGFTFELLRFLIEASIYLILGLIVFRVSFSPSANYIAALLVIILGFLASLTLGLLLANTFWLFLYREDVHINPFTWLVTTAANVVGGAYFPIEVLPSWLRPLSYLLPHTYVFSGVRKALLLGVPLGGISEELTILSLYALLLPVAILLYRGTENFITYKARKL